MTGLAFQIPIALAFGVGALWVLRWALGNGQYDDPEGAALRILSDLPPLESDPEE